MITITFLSFDVDSCSSWSCDCDKLEIFDGANDLSPRLVRVCGTQLPDPITSATHELFVKFTTDAALYKGNGFLLRWESALINGNYSRYRMRNDIYMFDMSYDRVN